MPSSKQIKLVSYWPMIQPGGVMQQHIRHTSPADAAYLAGCQSKREFFAPSASVWMIPGVEDHD